MSGGWWKPWTFAAAVVAVALYVAACSNAFYELTSPSFLSWHVALRKVYSIGAFALVGFLYRKARGEFGATSYVVPAIVGVAAYSASIEVGQFFSGSKEGVYWNIFDTACGAVGGAVATVDLWARRLQKRRVS